MSYDTDMQWTYDLVYGLYRAKQPEPKEEPAPSNLAGTAEASTASPPTTARLPSDAASQPLAKWENQILSLNGSRSIRLTRPLVRAFVLHVALNMDPTTRDLAPLLFALNGPFGCGKTSSLLELMHRMKMLIVGLDASEFEDSTAHVPVRRFQQRYIEASELQQKENRPAVLLVNDADRMLAVRENTVRTTIHKRLMDSVIINAIDNPYTVGGKLTERVVIAFTTNSLVDMYGALTRPNRMRVFLMQPSPAEVMEIVPHMFREILSVEQAEILVKNHPNWSLAAFSQVRSILLEYAAYDRYRDLDIDHLHEQIMRLPGGEQDSLHRRCDDGELQRAIKAVEDEEYAKRDFTETK